MLYQTVMGPQIQNFTLKCCFLAWRRASEKFYCFPKVGKKQLFLKAKNKEKLKKIVCFYLTRSLSVLPILGRKIKFKIFLHFLFDERSLK